MSEANRVLGSRTYLWNITTPSIPRLGPPSVIVGIEVDLLEDTGKWQKVCGLTGPPTSRHRTDMASTFCTVLASAVTDSAMDLRRIAVTPDLPGRNISHCRDDRESESVGGKS